MRIHLAFFECFSTTVAAEKYHLVVSQLFVGWFVGCQFARVVFSRMTGKPI
jgi:uncharacterized membrane protein AbrB (regulator of aidB expression)